MKASNKDEDNIYIYIQYSTVNYSYIILYVLSFCTILYYIISYIYMCSSRRYSGILKIKDANPLVTLLD